MKIITLMGALMVCSTAHAQASDDGETEVRKKRLKLSTPVFLMNSDTFSSDSYETTMSQSGVTLFTQPARLEFSYRVAKQFELGAMFSFGGVTTDTEYSFSSSDDTAEDTGATDSDANSISQKRDESIFYLTGIYNMKLSDRVNAFLQPIVGISYANDVIGDTVDNVVQNMVFGGDLGVRFVLRQGVHLDLAAEYLAGSGTFTDIDGNEMDVSSSAIALRTGLGARF